jgi:hypothetical protein
MCEEEAMSSNPSLRRLTPLLGLLAVLLALQVNSAGAGIGWCSRDPVFELGGRRGHVYVSSPQTMLDAASGPIQVVVTVPKGVEARLISTDEGFGYGYKVSFKEINKWKIYPDEGDADGDGFTEQLPVRVAVRAPARGEALPVVAEFVARGATASVAEGMSNEWIVLRSYL